MIKIQKLDQKFQYRFLWLLGAAALATALDQILDLVLGRFIGIVFASYISTPIVVAVLLFSLKKITRAPYIDVLFTVAISYALLFGVNLFILGSLMGDLRPPAGNPEETEVVAQQQDTKKDHRTAAKTNQAVARAKSAAPTTPVNSNKPAEKATPKTNAPAPSVPANPVKTAKAAASVTNPPAASASTNAAKPAVAAATVTNPPAPSAPTNAAPPPPARPIGVLVKYYAVKGVTENGAKSSVTIQCGTKIYTVYLGETAMTQTPESPIPVHFKDLAEDWVDLEIDGQPAKLPIH